MSRIVFLDTDKGLLPFRSTPAGWEYIPGWLAEKWRGRIHRLAVDPHSRTLYAGGQPDDSDNDIIYQSRNNGRSWSPLSLENPADQPGGKLTELFFNPHDNKLWAVFDNRLYFWSAAAPQWQERSFDLPPGFAPVQAKHSHHLLAVSPHDPTHMLWSAGHLVRRTDADQPIFQTDEHIPIRQMLTDPDSGTTYLLTDDSRLWQNQLDDPVVTPKWDLLSDRTEPPNRIVGIAFDQVRGALMAPRRSNIIQTFNKPELTMPQEVDWLKDGRHRFDDAFNDISSPDTYFLDSGRDLYRLEEDGETYQHIPLLLPAENSLPDFDSIHAVATIPFRDLGLLLPQLIRYPVDFNRLEISRTAVKSIQPETQLRLMPATGLVGFLNGELDVQTIAFPDLETETPLPLVNILNNDNGRVALRAMFGIEIQDEQLEQLNTDLSPGLRRSTGLVDGPTPIYHLNYRQMYQGLRVLGGSVRLHGQQTDARAILTSSYWPIPDGYFGDGPTPLTSEEETLATAKTAVAQHFHQNIREMFRSLRPKESLSNNKLKHLAGWVVEQKSEKRQNTPRNMASLLTKLRRIGPGNLIPDLSVTAQQATELLEALVLPDLSAKIIQIESQPTAILPYGGDYLLISRVSVTHQPTEATWLVDVDRLAGGVVGEPWQAILGAPSFFATSAEALPGGQPSGDVAAFSSDDTSELAKIIPNLATLLNDNNTATVAAHALKLYLHLRQVCGVPHANFILSQANGSPTQLTIQTNVPVGQGMGFSYGNISAPSVSFWGQTIPATNGSPAIISPLTDPELIVHEFVHAYLWLLNGDPWDTFDQMKHNPFARALHEGYAMYLARSLAARVDPDQQGERWARSAYQNWGVRWALARSENEPEADFLVIPNSYPMGAFFSEGYVPYDVGMVWARALWDLRTLVSVDTVDKLVVQAFFYLHGHIANFSTAAEAIMDVAQRSNVSPDGWLSIWLNRGIAAGRAVHGFASSGNQIIAATDAGIVHFDGTDWTLQKNNLAIGGTLTGVTAVAAHNGQFFAAAQLPPADLTQGEQWQPDIYWQVNGRWQSLNLNTDVTPLSLFIFNTTLFVGTSDGVRSYDLSQPQSGWHNVSERKGPTEKKRSFISLGMANIPTNYIQTITPDRLYQCQLPWEGNTKWEKQTLVIGNSLLNRRFTAIAPSPTGSSLVFLGTNQGLLQVDSQGTVTQVTTNTEAVLAIAAQQGGQKLAFATANQVFVRTGNQNFTARPADKKTRSLFVHTNGDIFLGGRDGKIWRSSTDGVDWTEVY